MTTTKKFQVGQTVLVRAGSASRRSREEEVTKVGRTLVYVGQGWREQAFYIETGRERRSVNAPGVGDYVLTLDEAAERERRSEIVDRLEAHGIRDRQGFRQFPRQTTDVLARLLAVLDEAEPQPAEPVLWAVWSENNPEHLVATRRSAAEADAEAERWYGVVQPLYGDPQRA